MIIEVAIFIILFIMTFLLLSKYRIALLDAIVGGLATAPVSHDTRLEGLLEIAGRYYSEKNFLASEHSYL